VSLRAAWSALHDLVRGLLAFPIRRPPSGAFDAAADIEARYARPRRCC
jgi:hypothetical protein